MLPYIKNGERLTRKKLFRYNELNYGMKQITPACAAIVSGGTGTWGYKIRTEGKTELVMVEIEQKDA